MHLGANLDITALTLGYFVLIILGVLTLFLIAWLGRNVVHHHRRKRFEEAEMEHARSQWFFEGREQDRQDTDILDFPATVEYEAVSYLKENDHGHRQARKPRNQARRR